MIFIILALEEDANLLTKIGSELPYTTNCKNFIVFGHKVQLIESIFDNVAHIMGSFDFHCNTLLYDGRNLLLSKFAIIDIAQRRLRPNCIKSTEEALMRLQKFTKEGWTANITDIKEQIST